MLLVKDDVLMNMEATRSGQSLSELDQLRYAREILCIEGRSLLDLAERLDSHFCQATQLLFSCNGNVIVTGMGKAGLVGQKIAATLASTGTRSHFLHPAEAIHGDLGRLSHQDIILLLSQSGETEEIVRLLPFLLKWGIPLIAITGNRESTLGHTASVVLELGSLQEACSLGLAPSTSTTAMIAVGDALALVTSRMQGFSSEDFAKFHPGGSLGRKLAHVEDVMRPLTQCRTAPDELSIREVLVREGRLGRRTGAIMLTNKEGSLTGIFTDSDLARLFEARREDAMDKPISDFMTTAPATVTVGTSMAVALETIVKRKISELPVIDSWGHPQGLIDITDIVELPDQAENRKLPDIAAASSTSTIKISPKTLPFPNQSRGSQRR